MNGMESRGRKAIEEMYAKIEQRSVLPRGAFHMLLTNPIIRVNGDSATADVVWTGIVSDALKAPPRFVEQGRERDELVKVGGHWYIKHRWITADSGLPNDVRKDIQTKVVAGPAGIKKWQIPSRRGVPSGILSAT